jgi:hypothetical protein
MTDIPPQMVGEQGYPRHPVAPSNSPQALQPGSPTPAEKEKKSRPVRYPHQLRVNINTAMAMSLERICARFGIPEGIGARIAIAQYCAQLDPQYRGDING